jgi:hypothetical protein
MPLLEIEEYLSNFLALGKPGILSDRDARLGAYRHYCTGSHALPSSLKRAFACRHAAGLVLAVGLSGAQLALIGLSATASRRNDRGG